MDKLKELLNDFSGNDGNPGPFPAQEIRMSGYLSYMLDFPKLTESQFRSLRKEDVYSTLTNHYYNNTFMVGSAGRFGGRFISPPQPKPLYKHYTIQSPSKAIIGDKEGSIREWSFKTTWHGLGFLSAIKSLDDNLYRASFVMFIKSRS